MTRRLSVAVLGATLFSGLSLANEGTEFRVVPTPGVILAMAQTADGHMWFGTTNGLFRYDGQNILPVPLLTSNGPVRILLASKTGGLWAATGGGYLDSPAEPGGSFKVSLREGKGGLVYVEGLESRTVIPADGTPASWVWSLAERPEGGVWLGGEAGLLECEGSTLSCAPISGVHPDLIAALLPDDEGGLWMGKSDGLWHWSRANSFHVDDVDDDIRNLKRQSSTQFWALSQRRLMLMENGRKLTTFTADPGVELRVVHAGPSPAETLIGSTRGLMKIEGTRLVMVPGDLPANSVRNILTDHEGSVWITVKGTGVLQRRVAAVRNWGLKDGLISDLPLALLPESSGSLLVSTRVGLARLNKGVWTALTLDPQTAPWNHRQLARSSNGDVWFAGDDLVHLTAATGEAELFSFPSLGLVRALHIDEEDQVWMGWEGGGVARFSPAQLRGQPNLLVRDGLCPGSITHIVPSQLGPGALWMAGSGGISHWRQGIAVCRYAASSFDFGEITSLLERPAGILWITAVGNTGLMMAEDQRVLNVPAAQPFPGASLYEITSDGGPYLWFSSPRGVFRVAEEDLILSVRSGKAPSVYHADEMAGMRSADGMSAYHPNIVPNGHGGVFVATSRDLSEVLAPETLPVARIKPVIDAILVDGVRLPAHNNVRVPPQPRNLEIRFSAATFLARPRPILSHQLEGWDSQAITTDGTVTSARYAALPPGKYRFRLRATSAEIGVASPVAEASLGFTVVPTWHQRWSVRALLGFLVLVVIVIIHRRETSSIRRGYEAIQGERTRIARELHDGLAQFFTGMGLQLEALRTRIFTAPEKADELIVELKSVTREAQADTKRTIWGLREGLAAQSVTGAIEAVVETARQQLGIHVTSRYIGAVPQSKLLEEELPQITREALTNAVRHGKATATHVELTSHESKLQLTIDDNGGGLQSGGDMPSTTGLGIVGIRERAKRCGGTATLTQRLQGGARLCVSINREPSR